MKFYYWLTAWLPRRLPTTEAQWDILKGTLVNYFGVLNQPDSWATIAGHVSSTPSWMTRRSYQYLANVAHRLVVNRVSQGIRMQAGEELKKILEKKMEEAAAEAKAEELNKIQEPSQGFEFSGGQLCAAHPQSDDEQAETICQLGTPLIDSPN